MFDFPRPPISFIERLPHWDVDILVGDSRAMGSPAILAEHGVTTVVNCAINLDMNIVPEEQDHAPFRYYKLGLIDGNGNPQDQMIGAYFILRAALDQVMPERPTYPNKVRGNVMVNCRGGRSRSVTLVALFLHLEMPQTYPTLESAIQHIREKRELRPEEWHETPKPMLMEAARHAARQIERLR